MNDNKRKSFRMEGRKGYMKKVQFRSYEELPLMLSVPEMAAALASPAPEHMSWFVQRDSLH